MVLAVCGLREEEAFLFSVWCVAGYADSRVLFAAEKYQTFPRNGVKMDDTSALYGKFSGVKKTCVASLLRA